MMPRTTFRDLVPEGSSRLYEATLLDHQGVAIPSAAVTGLALTLRDQQTNDIVNGRDNQSVLNANGGTLSPTGLFQMLFTALDTASLSTAKRQVRMATFKLTYLSGTENHEVQFTVFNMADVP